MRSPSSLAAGALLLAACGNYSTDDVAFVEALPAVGSLQARVPLSAAGPAATCGTLGSAGAWASAKPKADQLNSGVDAILTLVDAIRAVPPTRRDRDQRTWGPFPDRKHPGIEIRVVMTRTWAGDLPTYSYAFDARPQGTDPWNTVLDGTFVGGSARTGHGTMHVYFAEIRSLGMSDHPLTDPTGTIAADYDKTGDPQTLALDLAQEPVGGFGLDHFTYAWAGWADGFGHFDYAVHDTSSNRLEVTAKYAADASGYGSIAFYPASLPGTTYFYEICWDALGCTTAVNDLQGVSGACATSGPCVVNWPAGCPVVR